jgi:hypothetical protein
MTLYSPQDLTCRACACQTLSRLLTLAYVETPSVAASQLPTRGQGPTTSFPQCGRDKIGNGSSRIDSGDFQSRDLNFGADASTRAAPAREH